MNKLRVIDLLNKIANGEIPKKIIYDGTIYKYDNYRGDSGYVDKTQLPCKWFVKEIDWDTKDGLNDEVEIIEEDKKIDKIKTLNATNVDIKNKSQVYDFKKEQMILDIQTLQHWINKIIDYLEEKE